MKLIWWIATAYSASDLLFTVYRTVKCKGEGKDWWVIGAMYVMFESIVLASLLRGRWWAW